MTVIGSFFLPIPHLYYHLEYFYSISRGDILFGQYVFPPSLAHSLFFPPFFGFPEQSNEIQTRSISKSDEEEEIESTDWEIIMTSGGGEEIETGKSGYE